MFSINLIEPLRKTAPPKVFQAIGPLADVSTFVRDWGWAVIVAVGILVAIFAVSLPYWIGPGRVQLDKFPPWSWYRIAQGSSFLLALSALMRAQVPITRALEILEERGSPWWSQRVVACRAEVMRGAQSW